MKAMKMVSAVFLVCMPLAGCAEESGSENYSGQASVSRATEYSSELQTELRDSGEILAVGRGESGGVNASYFYTSPPSREELASRIVEMMSLAGVSQEFIQKIGGRLQRNRTLNKEEFSLPLTDVDGKIYQFSFSSDIDNSFYVINYTAK
ncbi:hypothetical protein [Microbulbifer aggregans]|uniref:hypothetical protein n=1 Tax=Microbulbifer aggregans TaxID=1769779 RepID=UPI001CFC78E4|nr:hypothetical protein [Microbulbifer aggregans]